MNNQQEPEKIEVGMNAGRVCDAIARIGYDPPSAIMDIVDNSVTAGATNVIIEINYDESNYHRKNNITSYRIIDNGSGMNNEKICEALKLGSEANYPPNSLSKYGLGLKSAGFSLGTRIEVQSKSKGEWSAFFALDKKTIVKEGKWVIEKSQNNGKAAQSADKDVPGSSGTIITIGGCKEINHDSAKKTCDRLLDNLGVVYYEFLRRKKDPLKITLRRTGKEDFQVQPFDILFWETAQNGFDPDKYDCLTPRRATNANLKITDNDEKPMTLEAVIFPQQNMARFADFTEEQREQIKKYDIKRENKGFFIYRNERLIRWGDNLNGIVGRDDLGFRARIRISTCHDDVLHVDVSKQDLAIPEDILQKIEREVFIALRDSRAAFKLCAAKCNQLETEGASFNEKNQDLVEEDPDEGTKRTDETEIQKRRKKVIEESKKALEDEPKSPKKEPTIPEIFQKVRYSDTTRSDSLWEAHLDPTDGTFVRINKNHPYYLDGISKISSGKPERELMEAFLWCLGAAEITTLENLDLETKVIEEVLHKFKRVMSYNLGNWCAKNRNLFDE